VTYNELIRDDTSPPWFPEMSSDMAAAHANGASHARLLMQSNPVTGVGVLGYDLATASMNGDWGSVAEMGGGLLGGFALGRVTTTYGGYGVRWAPGDIGTMPMQSQRGATSLLNFELERPITADSSATVPKNPSAYSIAFEMRLKPADFGKARETHFNRANAALDAALKADVEFAAMMERLIPGVQQSVSNIGGRAKPAGWTWEHASSTSTVFGEQGVMRLVPTAQHTPGSPWWRIIHPNRGAAGGYSEWAIPAGAPKN
jgi:hypothetical protein